MGRKGFEIAVEATPHLGQHGASPFVGPAVESGQFSQAILDKMLTKSPHTVQRPTTHTSEVLVFWLVMSVGITNKDLNDLRDPVCQRVGDNNLSLARFQFAGWQ